VVNPAGVWRRRSVLPREICVSHTCLTREKQRRTNSQAIGSASRRSRQVGATKAHFGNFASSYSGYSSGTFGGYAAVQ
jgi:hypothetical protein